MTAPLSIGQTATLACVLEATAHKPGNVHRGADFADMTYLDMVASAIAIGPAMEKASQLGVGSTILTAVQATQQLAGKNTNLGTVILLAPLAVAANSPESLRAATASTLKELTAADASETYAAIRTAKPAGLGEVTDSDVHAAAAEDLLQAMELARDRDLVAKQYVSNFSEVFDFVLPRMVAAVDSGETLLDAIVLAHVGTMAEFPDSLIARKCGDAIAREAADRAARVLEIHEEEAYLAAVADFDFWLRSDGHRRNPGTSADMIAAALYTILRQRRLQWPVSFYGEDRRRRS